MPDLTPADQLRAAADRAREIGDTLHTELGNWLEATAHRLDASTHPDWQWAVVEPSALAVARQLLGATTGEGAAAEELEPVQLRWGLDDVMYGDDDTTTVLLSGPGREPYWVELDPERTAALRDALMGPTALPAPADRAAVLREAADHLDASERLRDLTDDHMHDVNAAANELRRLAGEAAAGAHQTEQAHRPGRCPVMIPSGGRCEKNADHQTEQPDDPHTPTPAVPAAPEETR